MSRIAWKIGVWTAILAAAWVVAARVILGPSFSLGVVSIVAAGLGGMAYGLVWWRIHLRLEHLQDVLHIIRRQEFEKLADQPLPPGGDELDACTRQVVRTGQSLEREIDKLKKMENYRREFVGNVSHELKTPIFAIQGFTETLLNGALEDPEVNRTFVVKIKRNADRLDLLSRDLMEISRIETGQLEMKMEAVDVETLCVEVIESLEGVAQSKEVCVRLRSPGRLPSVRGDRDRLRQVLTNLVDNAIKYNEEGGQVEIVLRRLPVGEVKVSIVDDGVGVPSDVIPRLTERFFRVDTSRSRAQGGTGLGLAIVKHILNAHGSALRIDSVPGQGSTFGFTLSPARDMDVETS